MKPVLQITAALVVLFVSFLLCFPPDDAASLDQCLSYETQTQTTLTPNPAEEGTMTVQMTTTETCTRLADAELPGMEEADEFPGPELSALPGVQVTKVALEEKSGLEVSAFGQTVRG